MYSLTGGMQARLEGAAVRQKLRLQVHPEESHLCQLPLSWQSGYFVTNVDRDL